MNWFWVLVFLGQNLTVGSWLICWFDISSKFELKFILRGFLMFYCFIQFCPYHIIYDDPSWLFNSSSKFLALSSSLFHLKFRCPPNKFIYFLEKTITKLASNCFDVLAKREREKVFCLHSDWFQNFHLVPKKLSIERLQGWSHNCNRWAFHCHPNLINWFSWLGLFVCLMKLPRDIQDQTDNYYTWKKDEVTPKKDGKH